MLCILWYAFLGIAITASVISFWVVGCTILKWLGIGDDY